MTRSMISFIKQTRQIVVANVFPSTHKSTIHNSSIGAEVKGIIRSQAIISTWNY